MTDSRQKVGFYFKKLSHERIRESQVRIPRKQKTASESGFLVSIDTRHVHVTEFGL